MLRGDTGFPRADVESDFLRARRRTSRPAGRTGPPRAGRRRPLLPFDGRVTALGRRGEHRLGLQTIPLGTIVGTLDARRDFDPGSGPPSNRLRTRWVRLALWPSGAGSPPAHRGVPGRRVHFVADGHHRVSIAGAARQETIDAYVTEVAHRPRPPRCPARAR